MRAFHPLIYLWQEGLILDDWFHTDSRSKEAARILGVQKVQDRYKPGQTEKAEFSLKNEM